MEDLGGRLRAAETRRQVALRDAKAATDAFRALVLECHERGMSKAEAARQAGISRETVYRIIARK